MIFDTTFVIDFLNGKNHAVSKMQSLIEESADCAIAAPTVFELWSGIVSIEKGEKEISKTKSFIESQVVYYLDDKSAENAGKIHGTFIKKGLEIDSEDCMIAGIAIANNKKILTKNGHFKRIEGLKVEEY